MANESGWHYFAGRLDGAGGVDIIDRALPIADVALTDVLSGPRRLTGKISPSVLTLTSGGRPILREWETVIWAEDVSGTIHGGGILTHIDVDNADLSLDCVGFTGYPAGMPYVDSKFFVEEDPLDIVRHIWAHLQSQPGGNLGFVIGTTTTPIRLGTVLTQDEFDTQSGPVSFESGPYKLAWYLTPDLGKNIDDLAKNTPFDYHERIGWNDDDTVTHHLDFGYPRLGTRRNSLRFALNENVYEIPKITYDGERFANEILTLGAGEGRTMIRGTAARRDTRLRRATVVTDKTIRSTAAANLAATRQLALRQGDYDLTQLAVLDHPHARLSQLHVGDEIPYTGADEWVDVDTWLRILSITINPDSGDGAVLTVTRANRMPS